jgi:hypothetical protein
MSVSYIFRVITSITAGENFKRSETDYDQPEKAYSYAARWLEKEHDSALKGFTVSVSIMPLEQLEDFP